MSSLACRRDIAQKTVRVETFALQGDKKAAGDDLTAVRRYAVDHGISRDTTARNPLFELRQRRLHTATFMF